jgi:uncharacterized SAM-binding protein YcdF (DUF218 family)
MPLTIFWLIFLAGVFFYLLKHKRTSLVCGVFSIFWLAIISFPFLPDLLVKSLEDRFHPLLEVSQFNPKDSVYILVLGAGYTDNKNLPPNDQLSSNSLSRLSEAIRLHRLLNASLLVLSGSMHGQKVTEAELFMQTALALGVEENEIRLLGTPKNTRMEAYDYTSKFGTNNTLILVTDAIHMPRAMFLFQKAGQKPIPAPTNHLLKSNGRKLSDWLPSALNIYKMEYAMHEIIGLAWAKTGVRRRGE